MIISSRCPPRCYCYPILSVFWNNDSQLLHIAFPQQRVWVALCPEGGQISLPPNASSLISYRMKFVAELEAVSILTKTPCSWPIFYPSPPCLWICWLTGEKHSSCPPPEVDFFSLLEKLSTAGKRQQGLFRGFCFVLFCFSGSTT